MRNFGGSVRVGGLGATEMWGRPSGIQQPLSSSPTTRSHLPPIPPRQGQYAHSWWIFTPDDDDETGVRRNEDIATEDLAIAKSSVAISSGFVVIIIIKA